MKNKNTIITEVPDLKTLREVIEYGTKKGSGKKQFMYTDNSGVVQTVTFDQTWDKIRKLGTFLMESGLDCGKKIAIISENSYDWILSYYTTLATGNITVPLDSKLPPDELSDQLIGCECDAVFYSEKSDDVIEKIRSAEGMTVKYYFNMSEIPDMIKKGEEYLNNGSDKFDKVKIAPDDLACIVYTSGTTSKSKGVMLSHYNIASDATASCSVMSGGHAIGYLPLNHTYSWVGALFAGYIFAEWGYICHSLKTISDDIKNYHPQNFSSVPLVVETIYNRIWRTAKKSGTQKTLEKGLKISNFLMKLGIDKRRKIFSKIHDQLGGELELIICGGAALDPKLEKFMHDIGITVVNGYGITECSPAVTCNPVKNPKFGSVGLPLPCNEIKIHDPDKEGVGEVYVRGTNVMKGYYNNPQATAEAFDGEWFKTGDYGRIDEDGFLFFSGRKKNLIILSNGENVSPEQLEDKLSFLPYVKEVLVYEEDKMITAEFFLNTEEYPNAKELIKGGVDEFNDTMPLYKRIKKIKIRDTEFPKTTTLKIIRDKREQ